MFRSFLFSSSFPKSTAHYPWVVDWDNFALAFCQYYSLNPSTLGPETTTYKCAKLALGMPPPPY